MNFLNKIMPSSEKNQLKGNSGAQWEKSNNIENLYVKRRKR
jgi:hypothetical protein